MISMDCFVSVQKCSIMEGCPSPLMMTMMQESIGIDGKSSSTNLLNIFFPILKKKIGARVPESI